MGSVKDLRILKEPEENKVGIGNFVFSDRYSIFDWGEMPDLITNKGASLAVMAAFNLEKLRENGIRTHYKGLVDSNENLVKFQDLKEGSNGSNIMQVYLAQVHEPVKKETEDKVEYDYSDYEKNRGILNNFLVPLEIIFRNGLPEGSSVFKKIKKVKLIRNEEKREKALMQIYQDLGLSSEPKPGDMLPETVIGYTTKLEAEDRHLSEDEAYKISGLREEEFLRIKPLALRVNEIITEQAEKTGFKHYDGKVEILYYEGLVICDVVGTFDENRFGLDDEQVSKEVLRQWYKKNQPDWVKACNEWKDKGEGWQEKCPIKPMNLPEEFSELVSQMYLAGCNKYIEKKIFNVSELEGIMEELKVFK